MGFSVLGERGYSAEAGRESLIPTACLKLFSELIKRLKRLALRVAPLTEAFFLSTYRPHLLGLLTHLRISVFAVMAVTTSHPMLS